MTQGTTTQAAHRPLPKPHTLLALERYRRALPENESRALLSWASTFWPFQLDWLFEPTDFAIANKSRQIGTSHTTAGVGVLWGAFHGELTTIISIGETESEEVLDKCRRHVVLLQRLGSKMARTRRANATEIVFESGGRILALPSSGGRGFTGNVFLDEFAYQPHAGKVWDAAAPVTLLGFKMRVSSTPNGVGNDFHQLWELSQRAGAGWTPYEIPLSLAQAQGYPVDLRKCWALAKGDPRIFAQMFDCSFLDSELQYIPTEVIDECVSGYSAAALGAGEYFGGLDIGREADLTALVIVKSVGGIRYVVHVEVMARTDSDGLEEMVDRAFERFKLRRLCIDETGLGTFPAERIKKKHSERIDVPHRRPRVEPIRFTPTSKEDLATGLYASMTGKTLRLPVDDTCVPGCLPGTAGLLRKEVASIRRKVTAAGNVTYETPRTAAGHGDRAWGMALALHACAAPNKMFEAFMGSAA